MTDESDDIEAIERDIEAMRKNGSKAAIELADRLEVKKVSLQRKMTRIESLSIERLGTWMDDLRGDLTRHRLPFADIDSWKNIPLQTDALQGLELAWCVSAFRARDTAKVLGFDVSVVNAWFKSEAWQAFVRAPERRANQVASLADLAISRMAQILSIDTNDIELLKLQEKTAADVMSAGIRVPGALDKAKERGSKPASHKSLGPQGEDAVPRRETAVKLVPKPKDLK